MLLMFTFSDLLYNCLLVHPNFEIIFSINQNFELKIIYILLSTEKDTRHNTSLNLHRLFICYMSVHLF